MPLTARLINYQSRFKALRFPLLIDIEFEDQRFRKEDLQ